MVHNGIEYGDMQLIGEAYHLLKDVLNLDASQLHDIFSEWNKGELDSYLIQITADIFAKTDPETGKPMVDVILDSAGQKGTGKWTSQSALERKVVSIAVSRGIPVPAFASALAYYDSYRTERLPANLLQAQRDYFGAHTFERIDQPGIFHFQWTEGNK